MPRLDAYAIYNLATFIEEGKVLGREVKEAEGEYERAMEFAEFRARSALYAAMNIERRTDEMSDLIKAAKHLQICYSLSIDKDPHNLRAECLETCRKVVGRIRAHINVHGPVSCLQADDIFTSAFFDKDCIPVVDLDERFRYLWGAIEKSSNPSATASNTNFLLREACLHPRPSQPGIGLKGPETIRRIPGVAAVPGIAPILTSARKPGRNDPCSCGSGAKFKRCHGA